METATRFLNLLAGVLVLVTGLYVLVKFEGVTPDFVRLAVLLACGTYFAVQLYRQISQLVPVQHVDETGDNRLEF